MINLSLSCSLTFQTTKSLCFDTTGMFYWCPTKTIEQQTIVKLIEQIF